MEFVRNFTQLSKRDVAMAGGKGASLGEMIQAGIPVPSGFVVLSESFEQFLKETDLTQEIETILHKVDHRKIHVVEAASENIQALILSKEIPKDIAEKIRSSFKELSTKYVAIRSSATTEDGADHTWAGQLNSYLNITEENLLEKVKQCWASLFTPRAIFYRFEKSFHATKISVAVVIQKMIQSEFSGIAFSVHPVTEDQNQLIIEAGYGLGEAIVSGSITPDSYVVEKEPRKILDVNVNTQTRGLYRALEGGNEWVTIPNSKASVQVLSEGQIYELSDFVVKIENHYGFPCDIEWGYEAGKFYILQSRPITTLKSPAGNLSYFKKILTLDATLLFQEAATYATSEGLNEYLDEKFSFDHAPIIYFVKNGLIEFWQDEKVQNWINGQIIAKALKDKEFLSNILKLHKENISAFKELVTSSRGVLTSIKDLVDFYQKLKTWMVVYGLFYFIMLDDNLDKAIKEEFVSLREKDVFSEEVDSLIRKSVGTIYPDLKGCEAVFIESDFKYKPDLNILSERKEKYSLYLHDNISAEELGRIRSDFKFIQEIENKEGYIKGQSAYPGKVRGRVRIILAKEEIPTFQEGEILVTHMTTPDFIPALNKSVGFVTDYGGIMSHAAIIARELKKPSVVGTKNATEALREGDEVEIDADNGIVTIIKLAVRRKK